MREFGTGQAVQTHPLLDVFGGEWTPHMRAVISRCTIIARSLSEKKAIEK